MASGGKEDEVFDDEGKLLRTVFVENLPLRTKKKALTKEFTTFGVVDSVRICSVPLGDCTMEALQGGTMEGFFNLISYFETQSEPAFCSLASLSVVLNVLAIDPAICGRASAVQTLLWNRVWKRTWKSKDHDVCKDGKRQMINAEDVFKALDEIEFPEFLEPLRTALEGR
ncbi:hypothetical protein ZWY2020_053385 [Hordeum vulgare]|nr:hypothetical protein ZWY2020_053385 [Hordeum vulgare]